MWGEDWRENGPRVCACGGSGWAVSPVFLSEDEARAAIARAEGGGGA